MYESQRKFHEFAAARDVGLLEQAASLYLCPILRVDGTQKLHEITAYVIEQYQQISDENEWCSHPYTRSKREATGGFPQKT